MVVGLFCDAYPPEVDGVGMVVESYARELTALGHEVCLVTPKVPGCEDRQYPAQVIPFHGLPVPQAPQYRAGIPLLDPSYVLHTRKLKPQILHAHSPFGAGLEAVRLARVYDIPLVGTFHSKYYDDFYQATHSELLAEAGVKLVVGFYNACSEVWTVNEASANVLRSYGYEKEIVIMPNGTDLWYPTQADRDAASAEYGLADYPVFLFVGQQDWKKNLRHVIQALALYRSIQPNFRAVFVGQGPHAEEIKAFAVENGISQQAIFTGQLKDRTKLMGLYARADLFLFPSLYDTAGLVVREAAASGTPSLLVRNSCAAECIRENQNGFLCEDTPEDICRAIRDIMQDTRTRCRVGENARNTIPLAWRTVMEDVVKRYAYIIDRYDTREINLEE